MAKRGSIAGSAVVVAWLLGISACSRAPGRLPAPAVDADAAAAAALETYDADGNRALSKDELKGCPGVLSQLNAYDPDGNGSVTPEELTERFRSWQSTRVGLKTGYTCSVLLEGKPLSGATVRFVPERFMGDAIKAAQGIADDRGVAYLAIAAEDLSPEYEGLNGVQFGLYKVEITHPLVELPHKYNRETTLGCEIDPEGTPKPYTFNLRRS